MCGCVDIKRPNASLRQYHDIGGMRALGYFRVFLVLLFYIILQILPKKMNTIILAEWVGWDDIGMRIRTIYVWV